MTYGETRFDWDEAKNVANQKKHRISFEQASEVLKAGAGCLERFDHAHSGVEERIISLGPSPSGLLVVVWTERDENVIRIISARRATKRERMRYLTYLEQGR